ncbi:MAG: DUF938 domain-containing protein [Pseudomonadales bacterium]
MSVNTRPFSQACENNKEPILKVLEKAFAHANHVLEIGSGTGQHAAFFSSRLPHLMWQPSDVLENLSGIQQWVNSAGCPNLKQAQIFDVRDADLPSGKFDAVFSANTLHIMAWENVEKTFAHLSALGAGTELCVYGPFNYQGQFTSASNARFNDWLNQRDPSSAIRDFEAVNSLANRSGFVLESDYEMPANNRLLHWVKVG